MEAGIDPDHKTERPERGNAHVGNAITKFRNPNSRLAGACRAHCSEERFADANKSKYHNNKRILWGNSASERTRFENMKNRKNL
jgi:hypothetical protein